MLRNIRKSILSYGFIKTNSIYKLKGISDCVYNIYSRKANKIPYPKDNELDHGFKIFKDKIIK